MKLWPCGFKIEYTHLGFTSAGAVWQGLWNSDNVVLDLSIRSSALPCSAAVWLGFWNSDHVVLKSSIRSFALPCSAAVCLGFWNSKHDKTRKFFWTNGRNGRNRWTDKREGWNSYLDLHIPNMSWFLSLPLHFSQILNRHSHNEELPRNAL